MTVWKKGNMTLLPCPGDIVYVPAGDNHFGGKATVSLVIRQSNDIYIKVKEVPGYHYNWTGFYADEQEALASLYGDKRAKVDDALSTFDLMLG